MLKLVLGVTYGLAVGLAANFFLWWVWHGARRRGQEPLKHVAKVFGIRLLVHLFALLLFWWTTKEQYAFIVAGVGIVVSSGLSIFYIYLKKGGKLE